MNTADLPSCFVSWRNSSCNCRLIRGSSALKGSSMRMISGSEAKARAVVNAYPDALIIGSDQVAYLDDQIFGKPKTHDNAVLQLQAMRGRTVNFFTGLCLLNARTGNAHVRGIPTLVTFRNLTDEEIEFYLRSEKPYNCAGSAKSEGLGIAIIEKMHGDDPNALIGLPLIALCDLLRIENVNVLKAIKGHRA